MVLNSTRQHKYRKDKKVLLKLGYEEKTYTWGNVQSHLKYTSLGVNPILG